MYDKSLHSTVRGGIDVTPWMVGPPPAKGQYQRYPGRFLHYLIKSKYLGGTTRPIILEMFCGQSLLKDKGFVVFTTDIREDTGCGIVAPYDNLPEWVTGQFNVVIADPPYNKGFSNEWVTHKKDLPKPKRILREAARAVVPGGYILILHVIIIPAYKSLGVKRVALHPLLTGANNAIRVLNVFQKNG